MKWFIGELNYYVLQFFFIRIASVEQRIIDKFDMFEASILEDKSFGIGGTIKKYHLDSHIAIMIGAFPLSGWDNRPYRYIKGGPWYFRISKTKTTYKS